jgi:hypothetical protein
MKHPIFLWNTSQWPTANFHPQSWRSSDLLSILFCNYFCSELVLPHSWETLNVPVKKAFFFSRGKKEITGFCCSFLHQSKRDQNLSKLQETDSDGEKKKECILHYLPCPMCVLHRETINWQNTNLLLGSSRKLRGGTNTPGRGFGSSAKALEIGFDTVIHLFTTESINCTEERKVPSNLPSQRTPQLHPGARHPGLEAPLHPSTSWIPGSLCLYRASLGLYGPLGR